MLNPLQKSQLKNLLQSPQWDLIERLAIEYIGVLNANPRIGASEWETIRDTIRYQGQSEGIRNFFKELTKQANE